MNLWKGRGGRARLVIVLVLLLATVWAANHLAGRTRRSSLATPVVETPSWRLESGSIGAPLASPRPGPSASEAGISPSPYAEEEQVSDQMLLAASRSPCTDNPGVVADVRRYGAAGDGIADDTRAVQRASDAVEARGGGRVHFPAGVYKVMGAEQGSCVRLTGTGATLIHPDGRTGEPIIQSRLHTTTGSMARGSRVLRVASTRGIRPGVLVAVQAAGGPSRVQRTTLSRPLAPYVSTADLATTKGFQTRWRTMVFVGPELVTYSGVDGDALQNIHRAQAGTGQTYHDAGTMVAQAQRLYAVVVRVTSNRVILDRKAKVDVSGANVMTGSVGTSVDGLTFDGNRRPRGAATNPFPIDYRLARWAVVAGSTFRHGDHGGVSFDMGTRDSRIEGNYFTENGDPLHKLGAAIWLYRGATNNVVRGNTIRGRTFGGVMVDDRTEGATEFDADSNFNTIEANRIDLVGFADAPWNAGVVISGSSNNHVIFNVISNAHTGIMVGQVAQGPHPGPTYGNRVKSNRFTGHATGIHVTGSDNEFVRNRIAGSRRAAENGGRRNRFIDNVVE